MDGEYKERLPFGMGDLIVTKSDFHIQFYFSGPDLRYNGTLIRINKSQIDIYIKAYENNWRKYEELQNLKDLLGNEFTVVGEMNMQISIGGWKNGICIDSYHLPLNTEKDIKQLIESFLWAKEKGQEVMKFLESI